MTAGRNLNGDGPERLFQIIQILRSGRFPVTGRVLADELEISLRTLYRTWAELNGSACADQGGGGAGYVLEDGYDMPRFMLTADELEAAVPWRGMGGDTAAIHRSPAVLATLSPS